MAMQQDSIMPKTVTARRVDRALNDVRAELMRAIMDYPAMHSAHEGYAVLAEEVDELWDAVRMKQSDPKRPAQLRKEAVQSAAMAVRFMMDCCDRGGA